MLHARGRRCKKQRVRTNHDSSEFVQRTITVIGKVIEVQLKRRIVSQLAV